jgi:hypothetical protein
MRFLIMVKADAAYEAGAMPREGLSAAMADYHQALARAGVLLDAAGLQPSAAGWRIHYADGRCVVTDGPFAGSPAGLVAGYALIQVRTREEALEWSRRFPAPRAAAASPAHIEVRPLSERDDFVAAASTDRPCGLTGRPA